MSFVYVLILQNYKNKAANEQGKYNVFIFRKKSSVGGKWAFFKS